jgi:hypothetical protein
VAEAGTGTGHFRSFRPSRSGERETDPLVGQLAIPSPRASLVLTQKARCVTYIGGFRR